MQELAVEVAVLGQKMRAQEARMKTVEEDIRSLRSHLDRGLGILGFLIITVPVSLHFLA